jgi:hypothetical protein
MKLENHPWYIILNHNEKILSRRRFESLSGPVFRIGTDPNPDSLI